MPKVLEKKIGQHQLTVDDAGVLTQRFVGVISLEESQQMMTSLLSYCREELGPDEKIGILIDLSRMDDKPSKEVREYNAKAGRDIPAYGTCIFGASVALRITANFTLRALSLVQKGVAEWFGDTRVHTSIFVSGSETGR